jgi:hypothetical protein
VQISTVHSLSCALTKNARQRLCCAFSGLCRAPGAHGKPPVSRSASALFIATDVLSEPLIHICHAKSKLDLLVVHE